MNEALHQSMQGQAVVMKEHYYSVISKRKPISTFTLALI